MMHNRRCTVYDGGVFRLVICRGDLAFKLARDARGVRCNRLERYIWINANQDQREILCPVLRLCWRGRLLVMRRALPLSEIEFNDLRAADRLPNWQYYPGDLSEPIEGNISDYGWLNGRIVAVDYSADVNDQITDAMLER